MYQLYRTHLQKRFDTIRVHMVSLCNVQSLNVSLTNSHLIPSMADQYKLLVFKYAVMIKQSTGQYLIKDRLQGVIWIKKQGRDISKSADYYWSCNEFYILSWIAICPVIGCWVLCIARLFVCFTDTLWFHVQYFKSQSRLAHDREVSSGGSCVCLLSFSSVGCRNLW